MPFDMPCERTSKDIKIHFKINNLRGQESENGWA